MRVLIADDDPVSLHVLRSKLTQWGYDVLEAADGDAAWARLKESEGPTLAILDWMMPGRDGIAILHELRRRDHIEPYVYVIVLTSRNSHRDLIECMEAGADDFVGKPFDPHELRVRLRAGERIIQLQQELVCAREALRAQATHDSLTALWNRGAILELLERVLGRSRREGSCLGVAVADIDFCKSVNDRLGHIAGDSVLREVARRMSSRMRPYDLIGRYGGEEFLVILPGCDAEAALSLADRLCEQVRSEIVVQGRRVSVTISIGVACWRPGVVKSTEQLIREADAALYAAKSQGRNRAVLATSR